MLSRCRKTASHGSPPLEQTEVSGAQSLPPFGSRFPFQGSPSSVALSWEVLYSHGMPSPPPSNGQAEGGDKREEGHTAGTSRPPGLLPWVCAHYEGHGVVPAARILYPLQPPTVAAEDTLPLSNVLSAEWSLLTSPDATPQMPHHSFWPSTTTAGGGSVRAADKRMDSIGASAVGTPRPQSTSLREGSASSVYPQTSDSGGAELIRSHDALTWMPISLEMPRGELPSTDEGAAPSSADLYATDCLSFLSDESDAPGTVQNIMTLSSALLSLAWELLRDDMVHHWYPQLRLVLGDRRDTAVSRYRRRPKGSAGASLCRSGQVWADTTDLVTMAVIYMMK